MYRNPTLEVALAEAFYDIVIGGSGAGGGMAAAELAAPAVFGAGLFPDSLEINPYVTIMAVAHPVAGGITDDLPAVATTAVAGAR